MRRIDGKGKLSPSKEIAYIAMMCALLLGGQYALSMVAGVEIVTLLLVCFSYVFGARRGAVCAVAFSLLRCCIYGFYPSVVLLYLIYFPLLAAVFGGLGHIKESTFGRFPLGLAVFVNLLLAGIAALCACCYAFNLIKISRIYKTATNVLLWVIFGLCAALLLAFDGLFAAKKRFGKDTAQLLKLILLSAVAAVCTVCFTLLDDVLTPLMYGMLGDTALGYFYASFTVMLPQTVCTIVTVTALFLPLTAAMRRAPLTPYL